MSVKITKPRLLAIIACVSVLFNFLTPLFKFVRYMSDDLIEHNSSPREAASGYGILGSELFGHIEFVRSTLETGVTIHIVLSSLLLLVILCYVVKRQRNKVYEISAVSLGVAFSLMYTIFGIHGASKVDQLTHGLYSVTTFAYIPLIISCVLGIAYFIVYNYIDDDFTLSVGK